jgi:hypothetical protein
LKAGIVERTDVAIARQQHGEHMYEEMNKHITIVDVVFSMWSTPRLYNEDQLENTEYASKGSVKKNCHQPHEAWPQDKLTGDKLPVIN